MANAKPKTPAKAEADPQVQKAVDAETAQGFRGVEVDPTPNERYSLESDDFRTPETDQDAAAAVGSSRYAHKEAE